MKFKVGDKVRIVKNVWEYTHFAPGIDIGIGEVHTIIDIDAWNKKYPYKLDAYCDYTWREDELELVEDKKMFTKKDLKNGDVIKKRNGNVEILVLPLGTLVCSCGEFNFFSDIRDDLTSKNGSEYDIVAVRRPTEAYHCKFRAFKDEVGELVYDRERDTKPLYNGKVVCIDSGSVSSLTVGKIYKFVNGNGIADTGVNITNSPVTDFNDLARRFLTVKFIEIKE